LILSSQSSQESYRAAQEIKKRLIKIDNLEVLGPIESPIFKIKKRFRTRLLLRTKKNVLIQKNIRKIIDNLTISKKIKLTVDVDPINFS
jgi:primosomal protein N' (replication factor Y)